MPTLPTAIQLTPESYYLLRRPLLPITTLAGLHATCPDDFAAFAAGLLVLFETADVQEAIYTASPDLYQELRKFGQSAEVSGERGRKIIYSLYKYLLRSCTRATPYGMFAGCALGALGTATRLDFSTADMLKLTRLDMNYTQEIFQELSKQPALLEHAVYYTNNSLYELDERYRYVEYEVENKRRTYRLSSVAKTSCLNQILAEGRQGISYSRLLAVLAQAAPGASRLEAEEFIQQLIDAQLLISSYSPTITGGLYTSLLPERLTGIVDAQTVGQLTRVNQLLATGGVANFQQAHAALNEGLFSCSAQELVQTDLFFTQATNVLSTEAAALISAELSELYVLAPKVVITEISTFAQEFSRRYEEREVPLLLALDQEAGIGYGSAGTGNMYLPLVEGVQPSAEATVPVTKWTAHAKLVDAKYRQAVATGARTVELLPTDLRAMAADEPGGMDVPASIYALGSVIAADGNAVDAGNFRFHLQACGGPSAANLLGRFCYGDEELRRQLVESLAKAEPDTDAVVYAEIVHAPESRVGNILMRPHLRAYEIPYLSLSTVDFDHQLAAGDLLVSVRNGRIVLRSQRLNKRVIPRLSTAHNTAKGLPLYRFLADLQHHNTHSNLYWGWGALKTREFLPRVQYKHIILQRATWNLTAEQVLGPAGTRPAGADAEKMLYAFYQAKELPRYMVLVEGDNELLVDFEFPFSRVLLAQQLSKRPQIQLKEFLPLPDSCPVTGAQQARYVHELVLPLYNARARPFAALGAGLAEVHAPKSRSYPPGSSWVYFKVYGGYRSLEKVLATTLAPLLQAYETRPEVEKWFFIRYNDPEAHLRLRLKLRNGTALAQVLADVHAVLQPQMAAGVVHKIQLDTYVQELERYGGPSNIDYSENWFHCDSQAVLDLVQLLEGDEGETYRWLLAIRGLDELLRSFGLSLPQKHTLLEQLAQAFFREFHGDKSLQVQLDLKYREHVGALRSYLNPANDEHNGIAEAVACFTRRGQQGAASIAAIRAVFGPDLLGTIPGTELLGSYAHMYLNRILPDKARLHELVIYTMLTKYYASELAIARKGGRRTAEQAMAQVSGTYAA
jgi:thiopeptide-type bacteriocin biosynthesis protein